MPSYIYTHMYMNMNMYVYIIIYLYIVPTRSIFYIYICFSSYLQRFLVVFRDISLVSRAKASGSGRSKAGWWLGYPTFWTIDDWGIHRICIQIINGWLGIALGPTISSAVNSLLNCPIEDLWTALGKHQAYLVGWRSFLPVRDHCGGGLPRDPYRFVGRPDDHSHAETIFPNGASAQRLVPCKHFGCLIFHVSYELAQNSMFIPEQLSLLFGSDENSSVMPFWFDSVICDTPEQHNAFTSFSRNSGAVSICILFRLRWVRIWVLVKCCWYWYVTGH